MGQLLRGARVPAVPWDVPAAVSRPLHCWLPRVTEDLSPARVQLYLPIHRTKHSGAGLLAAEAKSQGGSSEITQDLRHIAILSASGSQGVGHPRSALLDGTLKGAYPQPDFQIIAYECPCLTESCLSPVVNLPADT